MEKDREFALLVGRAFLQELEAGRTESAVAFGRAFLLSMGMRGPEEGERHRLATGRNLGEQCAVA